MVHTSTHGLVRLIATFGIVAVAVGGLAPAPAFAHPGQDPASEASTVAISLPDESGETSAGDTRWVRPDTADVDTGEPHDDAGPTFHTATPVVIGNRVGQELAVSLGDWTPVPDAVTYQWNSNGAPISGADSSSYTPASADLGAAISVTVTAERAGYSPATETSSPVTIVAGALSASPVPIVTGSARVGATLTAAPGNWAPAHVRFEYQWLRSGIVIPGARSNSYTLIAADNGKRISVVVTGVKNGYGTVSRTSARTATVSPGTLTAPTPKISGSAVVGTRLTAVPGAWTRNAALTYQWRRDGRPIPNATRSVYTPSGADAGKKLTVTVTGRLSGYTAVAKTSSASTVLRALTAKPSPAITGTVKVGSTLTARAGAWKPAPVRVSYQWLRNGSPISNATKPTYRLTSRDAGQKISVRATGRRSGYASVTRTSTVRTVPKVLTAATPRITGSAKVGHTLRANTGTWTSKTSLSYQWLRNGTAIRGATNATYRVTSADVGRTLTVRVTGKKPGYASEARRSPATSRVTYPASYVPSGWNCPSWAPIKGNASSMIYHMPSGAYYSRTNPEMCFTTEKAAKQAGYRRSLR